MKMESHVLDLVLHVLKKFRPSVWSMVDVRQGAIGPGRRPQAG